MLDPPRLPSRLVASLVAVVAHAESPVAPPSPIVLKRHARRCGRWRHLARTMRSTDRRSSALQQGALALRPLGKCFASSTLPSVLQVDHPPHTAATNEEYHAPHYLGTHTGKAERDPAAGRFRYTRSTPRRDTGKWPERRWSAEWSSQSFTWQPGAPPRIPWCHRNLQ